MKTRILQHLVEVYAPDDIRTDMDKINRIEAQVRELRNEQERLESRLLDKIERLKPSLGTRRQTVNADFVNNKQDNGLI